MLAAFGTIGGALFGFDISSMSAWIGAPQYLEYFNYPGSTQQGGVRTPLPPQSDDPLFSPESGLYSRQITASMSAGSFVGAICAGFLADLLGRRDALKVASVIWVVGAAVQCSSQNVAQLVVGRIISGLSSG